MARVESPDFKNNGQVDCDDCPLYTDGLRPCKEWWYRNGDTDDLICPTAETYAAACELAEKEAHK